MTLIFIYNILLLLLYCFSLSVVSLNYFKDKRPLFLALIVFLSFFILDNVIIYMTEFLSSFSSFYNQMFLVVPIVKTCIYLVNDFCCLWIVSLITDEKLKKHHYGILLVLAVWMLSTPLLPDSALQVWLFYLPNQLFLIYLGVTAWQKAKVETLSRDGRFYLKGIAWLCLISGIAILAEDSFVIFNVDRYSSLTLKIFNRNFCEDLFSIGACLLILKFSLANFLTPAAQKSLEDVPVAEANPQLMHSFTSHYQLTQRETEIFELLLAGKNNQEIADQLYLSIGTVKTHVHNIFIKLEINKRNQIQGVYQEFGAQSSSKGV